MIKNLSRVFVIIALILGIIPFAFVSATGNPTISITASVPDTNGEINAVVSIKNNTGLAFFSLQISFDSSKLELMSSTQGQLRSVALPNTAALNNANANGAVAFSWVDADGFNDDLSLFAMKFKKKDETSGTTKLNITAGVGGIFDINMKDTASAFTLSGTEVQLGSSENNVENITPPPNNPTKAPNENATKTPTNPNKPPNDKTENLTETPTNQPKLPIVDTISEKAVETALESDNPTIQIKEGESTIISENSLQKIKDSGKDVKIKLPSGTVVTMDSSRITDNTRELDLDVKIIIVDEARMVDGIPAPDNSIIVIPSEYDDFGFVISVDITKEQLVESGVSSEKARLFRFDENGVYTEVTDGIIINDDGSVTLNIEHALGYILSEEDLLSNNDAVDTEIPAYVNNADSDDNFILWLCVGGGAVFVGAIVVVVIWMRRKSFSIRE